MNRRPTGGKIAMMVLLGIGAILLFGFIVMSLWNAVVVPVFNIGSITFWQALGLLILSKILFGGFKGKRAGFDGGPPAWRHDMREKWNNMTDEEREQVKQQWRDRCRSWGRKSYNTDIKPTEIKPGDEPHP